VLLVRLSHQFAAGEDRALSAPATLDLARLLAAWRPVAVVEMSLTVNQRRDELLQVPTQPLYWPLPLRPLTGATLLHAVATTPAACALEVG